MKTPLLFFLEMNLKIHLKFILKILSKERILIPSYVNIYQEYYFWRYYTNTDVVPHVYHTLHRVTILNYVIIVRWDYPLARQIFLMKVTQCSSHNLLTMYLNQRGAISNCIGTIYGTVNIVWSFAHQHTLNAPGWMPSSPCIILTHGSIGVSH